jgi:hypothetical protein
MDGCPSPFVRLGLFVICYSLLTDYELELLRFLRIRFHLLLDFLFGLAMLIIPTLLHLPNDTRTPVYVIGMLSILLPLTTRFERLARNRNRRFRKEP